MKWFASLLAALLLAQVGCSSLISRTEIDLTAKSIREFPAAPVTSRGGGLLFAVAAVNSPLSTFDAYNVLAHYLGEQLGLESQLIGSRTYAEINSLIRSGDATLAMVCTAAYVYGHEEFGMEILAVPVVRGEPVYQSYLIVAKDSAISTWQELRGHSFAFTDPMSNSGYLVPVYQLRQMGETPGSFFRRSIFTYSHDNSIKAVGQGLVDAANVDSLVYDYALARGEDNAADTRVIWRSPSYAINPVVVNPGLDPVLKAKLRQLLLELDQTAQGRAILDRLMFDRFIPGDDRAYDPVRTMWQYTGKRLPP